MSCFTFGMARLLDEQHVIPEEMDNLTVAQIAELFGERWEVFAMKCYHSVLLRGGASHAR